MVQEIDKILNMYNVNYKKMNDYYLIDEKSHYITFASEVNNEPDNLRIQTGNKTMQSLIRNYLGNGHEKPILWVIYPKEDSCLVAEFSESLEDDNLLHGNKSLKFKKTDFGEPGSVNFSSMQYKAKLFHLYKEVNKIDTDTTINIQPESDIYSYFKNFNYKVWNALSEFVDNSTASYFEKNHQDILNSLESFDTLRIDIDYDRSSRSLTIKDNAFGMELSDFKRAFRLKDAPIDKSGRNEFGMGLKTAAFWFGKSLTVESTEYGSSNKYRLTLDTDVLDADKPKEMIIEKNKVPQSIHGTTVVISNIYTDREITGSRTIGRIVKELSIIYRRDILGVNSKDKNRPVKIFFNGKQLEAEAQKYSTIYKKMHTYLEDFKKKNPEYKFLIDLNSRPTLYKKEKFYIEHNGIFHHIRIIIGFLNNTGASNAGLVLYRRGRVIEGRVGEFLKPDIIFGAPNSFESQRLFGEIDLDDIDVTQSKDSFSWSEDLQEKLYRAINERILDIKYIIQKFNKSDRLPEGFEVENSNPTAVIKEINEEQIVHTSLELESIEEYHKSNQIQEIIEKELISNNKHINNEEAERILKLKILEKASDEVFKFDGIKYRILFTNAGNFIMLSNPIDEEKNICDKVVRINIAHDLFTKFSNNQDFKYVITRIALAIVTSEVNLSEENEFIYRFRSLINNFISNRG
ncbi:hypothetical protein BK010_09310 [Tenericutes bacterium MO-XQ]|nr:hypothetical protein BK010_09310 [Tenericutes bacterium MO-XQ]